MKMGRFIIYEIARERGAGLQIRAQFYYLQESTLFNQSIYGYQTCDICWK